ncbi:MAG TPA: glycosyltransferase family 39 protein [Candidatus Methylomirabilis sp.]|nr:glycosyltransferase family 39 protein [Candidatus Methylomirabilis sp.]
MIAFLALFALACARMAWTTSPVFDEPGLLYSGYSGFIATAPKAQTANLIFAEAWAALPLLAMKVRLPTAAEIAAEDPARREMGRMLLFHEGNNWMAITRAGRAMIILLGLALSAAVYRWSRRLFGPAGGLVSLALCCLSPVVLSNSAVATTDIAVTLWFVLAVNRWWALLARVSAKNLLLSGVTAGLLLVTKVSGLLFCPMALILLLVRLAAGPPVAVAWPGRPPQLASSPLSRLAAGLGAGVVSAGTAIGVIWSVYGLAQAAFAPIGAPPLPWEQTFAGRPGGALSEVATALHEWRLLPDSYLFDVRLFEAQTSFRRGYLLGEYSLVGWWYFFPVALWFKTPIPAVALVALGLLALSRRGSFDRHQLAPLAVLALVYLGASLTSGVNIGIRHVLPVYPPLFIIAGAATLPPFHRWWGRSLVGALVVWSAAEAWRVHPQYMAYFNQLAGATEDAHRILVDSSYEWGQDLPAVERWLARRAEGPGPKPPVYFAYFGNVDLRRFKLDARLLPQEYELRPLLLYDLGPGTYIISATMLHTLYGPVMGPWRPSYEQAYRQLAADMARLAALRSDPEVLQRLVVTEGAAEWSAKIRLYDALRFARLCAYLRGRRPDDRITFGMLVFQLTAAELAKALEGPPAELRTGGVIRGLERAGARKFDFLE